MDLSSFAQLFDQISIHESVLVVNRSDDTKRELILVPRTLTERVIRFFHEGPGGDHQAPKSTSAKFIRSFWWPDLKRDVRLYVACCPVCEKFIRLGRTPRAGLKPMEVGGLGKCLSMDIVGGKDSFPVTPRENKYILTMIDCFLRFAVAVPLADQSASFITSAVLSHYITVYNIPCRRLTDQGKIHVTRIY